MSIRIHRCFNVAPGVASACLTLAALLLIGQGCSAKRTEYPALPGLRFQCP